MTFQQTGELEGMRTSSRLVTATVFVIAVGVYWRTAYPTITWWDSSSYSLAASTLGITSAPGSILLTLLGWPIAKLAGPANAAHALNLFAGVLAAVTTALVYLLAIRVQAVAGHDAKSVGWLARIGAAIGSLAFAFSATLWEHAIKFTPYVLTAVFTCLILLVMLRWWRDAQKDDAWKWIFALTLLFGLDFSVHRTNALLIPGAVAWITIRSAKTLANPRAIVVAISGMILGLLVQFSVMLVSATTNSPMNFFQPDNWKRFWEYVSLANAGGNFLVKLWPRNSDFAESQLADFVVILRDNFMAANGAAGVLALLPLLLAVAGLVGIWRRNAKLGIAFTVLLVSHALATVLYFNIPANFFRPFDRHYLPVVVLIGVLTACGAAFLLEAASRVNIRVAVPVAALLLAVAPSAQLMTNWRSHDASKRFFARDYAVNSLEGLPANAIYFTVGDNDTFPVMYVQAVEGVRPDVQIVNLSLANTEWFLAQVTKRDSTFPISMTASDRRSLQDGSLKDSVLLAPLKDSVRLTPQPTYGDTWIPSDVVLYDIVRTNAWRRPLAFSITMGENAAGWLKPLARLQGMHWEVWPSSTSDQLEENLMRRFNYRGYADSSIMPEPETKIMAVQYMRAFAVLLNQSGSRCGEVAAKFTTSFDPARLSLPQGMFESMLEACPTR